MNAHSFMWGKIAPGTQDVNSTTQDVQETSFMRSIHVICPVVVSSKKRFPTFPDFKDLVDLKYNFF